MGVPGYPQTCPPPTGCMTADDDEDDADPMPGCPPSYPPPCKPAGYPSCPPTYPPPCKPKHSPGCPPTYPPPCKPASYPPGYPGCPPVKHHKGGHYPKHGAACRITGHARTRFARLGRDHSFTLPGVQVACPASSRGRCTVVATAYGGAGASKAGKHVLLAKVRFTLRSGRTSAVRLHLTRAGKQLFARSRQAAVVTQLSARKTSASSRNRKFTTLVKAGKTIRHR
jgi:hypothetical protein